MMLNKGRHGQPAHPVAAVGRAHDHRPADARSRRHVSGLVSGYFDNHGWGFGMAVVTRRDEWRGSPGGSAGTAAWAPPGIPTPGGHGRHPDDPGRLDIPQPSGRLPRLLDAGLPGDRRLIGSVDDAGAPGRSSVSTPRFLGLVVQAESSDGCQRPVVSLLACLHEELRFIPARRRRPSWTTLRGGWGHARGQSRPRVSTPRRAAATISAESAGELAVGVAGGEAGSDHLSGI